MSLQPLCKSCGLPFSISERDLAFYNSVSPIIADRKYSLPPPVDCPSCREKIRFAWRNERSLYSRACDLTGKNIVSMYQPDTSFPVYERTEWWKDSWDALEYGGEYDFSVPFFEQFAALLAHVPRFSIYHMGTNENSNYSNFALDNKNCFLSFSLCFCEDCLYVGMTDRSKDCVDCTNVVDSELLYECIDCSKCYSSSYLERCVSCSESWMCMDCSNCKNCFGCTNLSRGEYCWNNEALSKTEYESRIERFANISPAEISRALVDFRDFAATTPKRFALIVNSEECTGDRIIDSRDCVQCFDIHDAESLSYVNRSFCLRDSYDGYGVAGHDLTYEIMSGRGYNLRFAAYSYDDNDSMYLSSCFNSADLFGCAGLRNKQYCILNKQYSRLEYFKLLPKIIEHMISTGEWGRFFPCNLSPFGYNETIANDYYPLSKSEALKEGFKWSDYEPPFPEAERTLETALVPARISEVDDGILNCAIKCGVTEKPFRITKQELGFYRKQSLPLPTVHPDARLSKRLARRNPRQLWERSCDNCSSTVLSTYAPKRPESVLCEKCYLDTVY